MRDIIRFIKATAGDDAVDFSELVMGYMFADLLGQTFEELDLETPEWLIEARDALKDSIAKRARDATKKEIRELEARIEATKTAAEKRESYRAKLKKLQARL